MPQLAYQTDPIRESLQLLGRKWTLLIIRDIAFLKLQRFGQILRNNPGLTPRVLSRRLEQMTKEGLVKKVKRRKTGEEESYGYQLAILRYGIKHCMKEKIEGRINEEKMIRDLHYDIPGNWSY